MSDTRESAAGAKWHTSDYLVRIFRGGTGPTSPEAPALRAGPRELSSIIGSPRRHERLSVERSAAFDTEGLTAFAGARHSDWALDALVGRITDHKHVWSSFRAAALRVGAGDDKVSPLREVPLDGLATLAAALRRRGDEVAVEAALLGVIAEGVSAGRPLLTPHLPEVVERLVQLGDVDSAATLMPAIKDRNWARHALAIELAHPRSGGSYEAMLDRLNEPYRRYGLEGIALRDAETDGESAFARLVTSHTEPVSSGPLVSVIMVTSRPGGESVTAAASIVAQTYANWELLVIDDASPESCTAVLDTIAALDPRIRLHRRSEPAGIGARLNEALSLAQGEIVVLQEADAWSHPRRLGLQVQDLLGNPARFANLIHSSPVTADLSFLSHLGVSKYPASSAMAFRLGRVMDTIGYFDAVWVDAQTEFAGRLSAATGAPAAAVLPGFPLQLKLIDPDQPPYEVADPTVPVPEDRFLYLSAVNRHNAAIREGGADATLSFPPPRAPSTRRRRGLAGR